MTPLRRYGGSVANAPSGGVVVLLGLAMLLAGCTNPRDARRQARDHRASAALEAAVHRETSARIRSVGCVQLGDKGQVCRVSFRGGRPAERWRLTYTSDSARVRRIG